MQPGGAGAERAVDEQVAAEAVRPGLGEQRACLLGGVHRDAPVRAHRNAVLEGEQFAQVLGTADVGTGALVDGDDAVARRGVERGRARLRPLGWPDRTEDRAPDLVVGVGAQQRGTGEPDRGFDAGGCRQQCR